jgi:hypothetical protein
MSEKPKKPIYKRWWFWVIIAIVLIGAFNNGGEKPEEVANIPAEQTDTTVINELKKPVDEPVEAEKPIEQVVIDDKQDETSETLSQKNAIRKAEQYLRVMAFSKPGLIEQLEHEGFSNEEATYAVNQLNVDWKEQAVKKAKSYLDIMAFSRSGLIEQLEFEGFTTEEATYAVDQIGL